jgi:protein ImuB
MSGRFVSIWFRHLTTDWFTLRNPSLKKLPFVLRTPLHGRMVITSTNAEAEKLGISNGMVLADARAIVSNMEVADDQAGLALKLLRRIAEWCIRFTPVAAVDPPDGILLDVTGCAHLWGGDDAYIKDIVKKINARGYDVRVAMADTPGCAWAMARFGKEPLVVPVGQHIQSLFPLPPEALRLEGDTVARMHKLGLHQISQFIRLPRQSLRRRFGPQFIMQLDRATGQEMEMIEPVIPAEPYQERLPCMEPIVTAAGLEMALKQLLEALCLRLRQDQKGLRVASFRGYRMDGKVEEIVIGTSRPSHDVHHLFRLFEVKISTIEPALGIELFVLEASTVEEHLPKQEQMWDGGGGLEDVRLAELIDHLAVKVGSNSIGRYVPDEHYWPERSFRRVVSLKEMPASPWRTDKARPLHVLKVPEFIEVTAPIPDYPPMLFRHNGTLHTIVRSEGPERIEQEWWLQQGQHRDYYSVEDNEGHRYWIFRLGHYDDKVFKWFLHGFFA